MAKGCNSVEKEIRLGCWDLIQKLATSVAVERALNLGLVVRPMLGYPHHRIAHSMRPGASLLMCRCHSSQPALKDFASAPSRLCCTPHAQALHLAKPHSDE